MPAKYRVLSADDEYWSRENIKNMIKWEDYDINFLEPASDGEEVLERIPEERPDIILTDINMPFLSGLELLEKISQLYPNIITIAISGYDDFQKVKGVFTKGGIDYLLKPVSREQLLDALGKALKLLEQREEERTRNENSRRRENHVSSYLEDDEYTTLLNDKLYHPGKVSHVPSTAEFSEVSGILVKFHDVDMLKKNYGSDILKLSYSIKNKLRKSIMSESAIIFNYRDKVNEFIIFQKAAGRLNLWAENILSVFSLNEHGPISIIIHDQSGSLDDVGKIYREMVSTLILRPFNRQHCILTCYKEGGKTVNRDRYTSRIEAALDAALLSGNKELAEEVIFKTGGLENCEDEGWSLMEVNQFVAGALNDIAEHGESDDGLTLDEVHDSLNYGVRTLNKVIVFDNISLAIKAASSRSGDGEDGSITGQVKNVKDYIEKHYAEQFSLSDLAENFHVDPSYLSRIFSKTYHETITAFVTRCRIEEAKKLMQDENNKLEGISFEVGYDDYNYFSRVFRKIEGVSPREYRKQSNLSK